MTQQPSSLISNIFKGAINPLRERYLSSITGNAKPSIYQKNHGRNPIFARFLPYLNRAVQNVVKRHFPEYAVASNSTTTAGSGAVLREFAVAFHGMPEIVRVRQLRTEKIGQLISISGTVTRTTEVRPELLYGSFTCNECGKIMNDVEQQFRYTEVSMIYGR